MVIPGSAWCPDILPSVSTSPVTVIIRHQKERLEKCSLHGLEAREDLRFTTFPDVTLPDLTDYLLLSIDEGAPELTAGDADRGLVLIDATWRLAQRVMRGLAEPLGALEPRAIPAGFVTAYPRRQTACPDPQRGLASVEALYVAHRITGRETTGLLDHYRWAQEFLALNAARFSATGRSG